MVTEQIGMHHSYEQMLESYASRSRGHDGRSGTSNENKSAISGEAQSSMIEEILPPPLEPLLITAEEFAGLAEISVRTLWRMGSAGQIPQPVRFGRTVRWRLAEVKSWIADGCPPPVSRKMKDGGTKTWRQFSNGGGTKRTATLPTTLATPITRVKDGPSRDSRTRRFRSSLPPKSRTKFSLENGA